MNNGEVPLKPLYWLLFGQNVSSFSLLLTQTTLAGCDSLFSFSVYVNSHYSRTMQYVQYCDTQGRVGTFKY